MREAEQLSQAVQQGADALAPLLTSLRFTDESRLLEEFRGRFAGYRALDRNILHLASEGSNLKAQRLSFGAAAKRPTRSGTPWRPSRLADAAADSLARRGAGHDRRAAASARFRRCRRRTSPRPTTRRCPPMEAEMAASETAARAALTTLGASGRRPVATAAGRRPGRPRPLHAAQRRDRRAVAAKHQRPVAGAVAHQKRLVDGGLRREPAGARRRPRQARLLRHAMTAESIRCAHRCESAWWHP